VAEGEANATEYDLDALFRCSSGEVFRVALKVTQGSGFGVGMVQGGDEATGAAAAAPAAVPAVEAAAQSVDDVLF
jgi:hypothetical protein